MVAEEAEGGGVSECNGGNEPTLLHVTKWRRKRLDRSVAANAATFPSTREVVGPNPSPLDADILKSPQPTIYTLRWLLQHFLWKQLHTKAHSHYRWRRGDRDAPGATLLAWLTGLEPGRATPLPDDWLPNHAQGGKFLGAGGQVAGSRHWKLIFERWDDHRLGDVNPIPRKDTVIFRVNGVKMLIKGIYRVMDNDKYHGQVPGQTLSRLSCAPREVRDGHAARLLEGGARRPPGVGKDTVCAATAGPGGLERERGHGSAGTPLSRMP